MRTAIYKVWENWEQIYHGSDSTVTVPKDAPIITKDYHSLWENDIRRYAQLHKILSTEIFVLELPEELQKRFWISLQQIEVSFLDIGEHISDYLHYTRHHIQMVPWDILSDLWKCVDCLCKDLGPFVNYLEKRISCFIAEKLWISDRLLGSMNSFHIFSDNVKIVRVDKNKLFLLVTDIGSSISKLLSENREAIDRILQTPS